MTCNARCRLRTQIKQLDVLGKVETDGGMPELVTSQSQDPEDQLLELSLETKPLDAEDTEVRLRLQIRSLQVIYGAVRRQP